MFPDDDVIDLFSTYLYTSFILTTPLLSSNFCRRYFKVHKYNICFKLCRIDSQYFHLKCLIRDENLKLLRCVKDTVYITVKSSNFSAKICITGSPGSIEGPIEVLVLKSVGRYNIELTVLPQQKEPVKTMKAMYDDEMFTDFKLVVKRYYKKGREVEESVGFHRAVLAAWSPFFEMRFTCPWKGKSEGVLDLDLNLTLEVIKAFKKYIYTDELPADRDTLIELMQLGYFFKNPKLEIGACKAIVDMTGPEQMLETIYLCDKKRYDCYNTSQLTRLLRAKVIDTKIDLHKQFLNKINP